MQALGATASSVQCFLISQQRQSPHSTAAGSMRGVIGPHALALSLQLWRCSCSEPLLCALRRFVRRSSRTGLCLSVDHELNRTLKQAMESKL